jgi:membrane protein insertase Oxa1/YidC/SpoIIIJ
VLKENADKNAREKYNEIQADFLWIENIWLADTTVNPVMGYNEFLKTSKLTSEQVSEVEYNLITEPIKSESRSNNGCYILAILAAGINLLSTFVNNWISKARAKKRRVDVSLVTNKSNKTMTFVMPVIMGIFTLFYNAAFGIYIVAGALITLITSPLVTLFVDMLEFDAISKEKNKSMPLYDRKRK